MEAVPCRTLMEMDLGSILFAFTFFIVLIKMADSDEKDTGKVSLDSLKTPLVIVVALALLLNISGFGKMLAASSFESLYSSIVAMVTSPVSAMILLSVGYELGFNASVLKEAAKVSGIRIRINAVICAAILITVFVPLS